MGCHMRRRKIGRTIKLGSVGGTRVVAIGREGGRTDGRKEGREGKGREGVNDVCESQ